MVIFEKNKNKKKKKDHSQLIANLKVFPIQLSNFNVS